MRPQRGRAPGNLEQTDLHMIMDRSALVESAKSISAIKPSLEVKSMSSSLYLRSYGVPLTIARAKFPRYQSLGKVETIQFQFGFTIDLSARGLHVSP